jgi:hypothetical protein
MFHANKYKKLSSASTSRSSSSLPSLQPFHSPLFPRTQSVSPHPSHFIFSGHPIRACRLGCRSASDVFPCVAHRYSPRGTLSHRSYPSSSGCTCMPMSMCLHSRRVPSNLLGRAHQASLGGKSHAHTQRPFRQWHSGGAVEAKYR